MDLMNNWLNNYNESTTSDDIGSSMSNGGEAMAAAATSSNKLPSSRYKGVVPQPNGRWGAQIYDKQQRVWLGTFNEEEEAAKAYDIAFLRFRGGHVVTNFNPHHLKPYIDQETETLFLKSHAKAEIVDMLRKHSYNNELEIYRQNLYNNNNVIMECGNDLMAGKCHDQREWLFEKVATPSDVGRLNRMVIPKQQAEKHFQVNNGGGGDDLGLLCKGVLMNFEDEEGKVWRFRYCYWGSSQSYVLTKGWTRFVKEKKLRAGDVVRFERSMGEDRRLFIECRPRNGGGSECGEVSTRAAVAEDLVAVAEDLEAVAEDLEAVQDEGVVRLFGVNIVDACSSCIVDNNRCVIEAWSEN